MKLTHLAAVAVLAIGLISPLAAQKGGRSSFGGGSSFGGRSSFGGGSSFGRSSGSSSFGGGSSFGTRSSSGSSYSKSYSSTGGSSGSFTGGGSYGSNRTSPSTGTSSFGSGGAYNSKPRTGGSTSFGTTRPSTTTAPKTSTSYRYKTYAGPSTTTYGGRTVYVNVNGGYSYYAGGPLIGYMPGYSPVVVTTGGYGYGYNPFAWVVGLAVLVVVGGLVVWAIRASNSGT